MSLIPLFKVHIPKNIGESLQKVFDSGVITEGEYSDQFQKKFGSYVQNENTNIVNSCTSALTLAYIASNIKPGDEVISTPMTCMATNEPIHNLGAKIVWADIDPNTGNIDPESVKKRITKKTKAIVGVHWAGLPFEIDEINKIASDNGLKVIEDAAHALGAKYKNKLIGSHSDFVCFSFQAIKHLTTVDGGAICSKNIDDNFRIKKLKWFGLDRNYPYSKWTQDIEEAGYKFHMNNVNSAIGIEQLKFIEQLVEKHKNNFSFYNKNINNKKIRTMKQESYIESSSWIYTVLVDDKKDLQNYLMSKGIASDVVHVRNDNYSVFKEYKLNDELMPGLKDFDDHHLNIPVGWWLSDDDLNKVVEALNDY